MDGLMFLSTATLLIIICPNPGHLKPIKIGVPDEAMAIMRLATLNTRYDTDFDLMSLPSPVSQTDYDKLIAAYKTISENQIAAVIGPHDSVIAIAAEQADIPYLSTASSHPLKQACLYNLLPAPCEVALVVRDIVKEYGWKRMAIFYEGDYGAKAADYDYLGLAVCEKLQQNPTSVMTSFWKIPEVPNPDEIRNNLRHIRSMNIDQIVLMAERNYTESILSQARKLSMVARPYSWLLINLGSEDVGYSLFDDLYANVTTVSFLKSAKFRRYSPQFSNLDLAVSKDAFAILDESIKSLQKQSKTIDGPNIKKQLYEGQVEGETGHVCFDKNGQRTNMTFDIMSVVENGLEQIAVWDASRPQDMGRLVFKKFPSNSSELQSEALRGRHLRVVTIMEKPFTMLKTNQEGLMGNARFEGFAVDLIEHISKLLGFTYELYEVHDGNFGAKNQETGEWNGMVGEIIAGNASMSVAPLSFNAQREEAIDFTKPFKTRGITLLLKKPQVQTSYFQFMSPLSMPVWLCILLSIAVISLIIFGLEHFSEKHRFDMPRFDLRESCWFVFGGLVQGSTESTPVTLPGRIVTSAWWFFSLILISTYTANLAAFLTVKKISSPITTVADLVGQNKVKYGTVRNSGIMHFFQNTQIETFQKMWTQMSQFMTDYSVNSTLQGVEMVKKGNYAFLWDSTVVSYIGNEDCDVMEIGPPFDHKGFGIAVPDGATYRDSLSLAILKLADQGIITQLEHRWWSVSACPDELRSTAEDTEELDIENVAGIFFVLIGWTVLALLVCLLERVYKRKRRKRAQISKDEVQNKGLDNSFEPINKSSFC